MTPLLRTDMSEQRMTVDDQAPAMTDEALQSRRDFLIGLGRWSKTVIGAALFGGLASRAPEAGAWANYRGGGGAWVNNRVGGGAWVNGGGGYGGGAWVNRAVGGGAWANNRGGGGAWANRRF